MKKIIRLMILTVSFISNSCQLPPSPNEPFYCKINGKIFRPEKDNSPFGGIGVSPLRINWEKGEGWFYLDAKNGNNYVSFSIKLPASEEMKEMEFNLTPTDTKINAVYSNNIRQSNSTYLKSISGNFKITKASTNKISGTFEFKTIDKSNKEYIISNGQFNSLSYH
jgi:hypothetical protein